MAVAIAQHQSTVITTGAAVASLPGASTSGNLLIAAGEIIMTTTMATPSGWTYLFAQLPITNVASFGAFWKISAGETSVTLNASAVGVTEMIEISGQAATSPLTAGTAVNVTTSPITPSVTVPSAGGLLLSIYASCSYSTPTFTLTSPSGQTHSTLDSGAGSTTEHELLAVYQTTSEPFSASQPYTDSCTCSSEPYGFEGLLLWIAPFVATTVPYQPNYQRAAILAQ